MVRRLEENPKDLPINKSNISVVAMNKPPTYQGHGPYIHSIIFNLIRQSSRLKLRRNVT